MKKKLMTVLALVLVIALSVAGTYAYLTSTAKVENTFTVGNVSITMDEAKVNADGTPVADAARVTANEYKLMPGHSYTKDPTVHVTAGSEACYVFVKVNNGIAAYEATDATTIANQIAANGWTALTVEGTPVENVYYKTVPAPGTTDTDLAVFGSFKIADSANTIDGWDNANNAAITVTACAVQADGFNTAADAYAAATFTA